LFGNTATYKNGREQRAPPRPDLKIPARNLWNGFSTSEYAPQILTDRATLARQMLPERRL
jgi:hypothetical protein